MYFCVWVACLVVFLLCGLLLLGLFLRFAYLWGVLGIMFAILVGLEVRSFGC